MARLLLSTNTAWNLVNFRSAVITTLKVSGHDVICAAPHDDFVPKVEALGVPFIELPMDSQGTSPVRDFGLFMRYRRIMREQGVDAYLSWTPKPNIYGGLAARSLGIAAIPNISGLGVAFSRGRWLRSIVTTLYRHAIANAACVFFQNGENRATFEGLGLLRDVRTDLLTGSGVDLERFDAGRFPQPDAPVPVFLMVCRLLWDKGVGEFVEAARMMKKAGVTCEFRLVGMLDVENPSAVPRSAVDAWVDEGVIRYMGATNDVRGPMAEADCVVLPSYYPEGTPRTLLEAAAMGRPIITSDMPGCRNAVIDGKTGYVCQAKSADALMEAMRRVLRLTPGERQAMGTAARELATSRFDEKLVAARYAEEVERALAFVPQRRVTGANTGDLK